MATKELEDRIKELEKQLAEVKLDDGSKNIAVNQKQKSRDYSTTKYVPKNPLGMKDYHPVDMAIREKVLSMIRGVFKLHGGVEISTPVVELKSTLTGKYGEDSKLIYDLKDQGGEILALRYDLTVPFARYCAQHKVESIKRYHISRVYRRDRPAMARGRYREFFQCDLDFAGTYQSMTVDAECLKVVSDCISQLGIDFKIKINHRAILDGVFEVCGVEDALLRPICSAVDKLDKSAWTEVKQEMIQKGLSADKADSIYEYVQLSGTVDLVKKLQKDDKLSKVESVVKALEEMTLLFGYLDAFGVKEKVVFDLSLARGLDYYTGMIFEAIGVSTGSNKERVGSVAAGGRYDGLIGMFKKNKKNIPCVGLSLGIERLFILYEKQLKDKKVKVSPTKVLVCAVGVKKEDRENILAKRLSILKALWDEGIPAETVYKLNPKPLTQFQQCEDNNIEIAVIVAPDELAQGKVKIRNVSERTEEDVGFDSYIEKVKEMLK